MGDTTKEALTLCWNQYIRDYEMYLKLELQQSPNTVEAYLHDVSHLMRYAIEQGLTPTQVSLDHLRNFLLELNHTTIAPSTQRRIIAGIRSFYHHLLLDDVITESPAELLELPKITQQLPDVLSNSDIDAIQATFDLSLPDQYRNSTIIEVLYGCGLRVSELTTLRLHNIHEDEEALIIVGKGNKERWVPINHRALTMLKYYIRTIRTQIKPRSGEESYVFLSRRGAHLTRQFVFKFLKTAVAKAGIQKTVSPHSLRHTFATELILNGADLRAVQVMLGHANIATTEIYTHLTPQYLRDTITYYHPHYKKK